MKSIKLIGMILLLSNVVHADIDFTEIKGLYTVFRTKKYLSPVHGFAWSKSGQIEELYRYGYPDHKTIQLIQELFYLNPGDEVTFAPTILPTKIGSHITPRALGSILKTFDPYLEKNRLSPSDEQHLEKALEVALSTDLNFSDRVAESKRIQDRLRAELEPEIAKSRKEGKNFSTKAAELDREKLSIEKSVADLKQRVTQLRSQRNNLKRQGAQASSLASKDQEIKEAEVQLQSAENELKRVSLVLKGVKNSSKKEEENVRFLESKIKNAELSHDSLKKFVSLLVSAFEETLPDNQRFVPFTIHNILLAMLWKKAQKKADFIQYFIALDHSVFTDSSVLSAHSPMQQRWLQERYQKNMYQVIKPLLDQIIKESDPMQRLSVVLQHYESLIAAWYSYMVFTTIFPPEVLPAWTSYEGIEFADCVETSLRNTINNLIYNPEQGMLDPSVLFSTFSVNSKLKDFYTRYNDVLKIQEEDTRKAWAAVTADLNQLDESAITRIDYRTPPCQVFAKGGMNNMRNLMAKLFGVKTIDEFFEKLPNVSVVTRFSKDQNFGVKTVAVRDALFNWYFDPKHAFVDTESYHFKTDPKITKFMAQFGQLFIYSDKPEVRATNNALFSLLMLYRDRITLFDELVAEFVAKKFPELYQRHLVFILLDSAYRKSRIEFVSLVLNNSSVRDDKQLFEFIQRIIKKIVKDMEDQKYYGMLISSLVATPALSDDSYPYKASLEKIVREEITKIKTNFPEYLPEVVDAIIDNQRESLYGMFKKNYEFSSGQLRAIASRKITKLYDHVRDYLKKVKMPLKSNDNLLITEIYKNNITEFDDILNKNLDEATRATLQPAKE